MLSDVRVWAQAAGNATYDSIGTEGFDTEPRTNAQTDTVARLRGQYLGAGHRPGIHSRAFHLRHRLTIVHS